MQIYVEWDITFLFWNDKTIVIFKLALLFFSLCKEPTILKICRFKCLEISIFMTSQNLRKNIETLSYNKQNSAYSQNSICKESAVLKMGRFKVEKSWFLCHSKIYIKNDWNTQLQNLELIIHNFFLLFIHLYLLKQVLLNGRLQWIAFIYLVSIHLLHHLETGRIIGH